MDGALKTRSEPTHRRCGTPLAPLQEVEGYAGRIQTLYVDSLLACVYRPRGKKLVPRNMSHRCGWSQMLTILILKRIRLNIFSLRFFYGLLLVLGLTALSGIVTTESLKRRMQYAQAREIEWKSALDRAQTYNQTFGQVILTPPTLSVVAEGIGDRFGMVARVYGQFGGVRIGGQAQSNRLLALLPIDLAHVVGLILSLLALLVTYDAICGERGLGTLRMVLSYNLPRRTLFVSEFLAALSTLLILFLPAILVWFLVVRAAGLPEFKPDHWEALAFFFFTTILLISTYAAVGLLLSSVVREPTTSLMLGLAIWVFTNSLYPSLAAWGAIQIKPAAAVQPADERSVFNQMVAQARLARNLQIVSPVQAFYTLAARMTGTDLEAYLRFVQYADRYQQQVADWHREKLSQHPERESRWSSGFDLLDIDGFPQPTMKADSTTQKIRSSLSYLSLMIAFNGVLVFATLLAINRYDPR